MVVRGKEVKSSLYHRILFTVLCVARYLKRSNELNIHKHNNYSHMAQRNFFDVVNSIILKLPAVFSF